jgi:phosphatidylglycerophosphatase A
MSLADVPRRDVQDVPARELPGGQDNSAPSAARTAEPVALTPLAVNPGSDSAPPVQPSARFMRAHPAHWLALAFGAGLSPVAAGTVGTLWAWLVWALWLSGFNPRAQALVVALSLPVAWWACTVTARHLRSADPGAIVVDEVVAFWLVLWLISPAGWAAQCAAFALFRFFDAAKPGPVGWADRLLHGARGWKGGWGILMDDLVAAFCTLLVMALWRAW